jgi:polygalacturonase
MENPKEHLLSPDDAHSAAAIQAAIDAAPHGGRVVLPAMELALDRGIELRSGIELVGQGAGTVLRKSPGRVYPLSGYHNYGMCDVPLQSSDGLEVGMTVSVRDQPRGGFYSTFARITWIDGDWVGLDHGIEADYSAEHEPCLSTAYPMIFGHAIAGAAVRDLVLDGARQDQEAAMDGCRGGAVYFANSRDVEVSGIRERNYQGEGIGFQMCRDMRVRDCDAGANLGNGIHPGAGSTNCLIERCTGLENGQSGFFFCVRANHITVSDCTFEGNGIGVSIGTRDCNNLIESCRILDNRGPGVVVRTSPSPTEVHSCIVNHCRIDGNATHEGDAQVAVPGDAHDLIIEDNEIVGSSSRQTAGILIDEAARQVYCENNRISDCRPALHSEGESLTKQRPQFDCGYGADDESLFRHLETP